MAKHTLDDVRAEYDRLDALCGVDTSGIKLRVSRRATRRYGYCHYSRRYDRGHIEIGYLIPDYISITDFILDCEDQFWDTIRHEYAHALVTLRDGKKHGHDYVWKSACREVGCNPQRLATDKEAKQHSSARREQTAKYTVTCQTCGRTWSYMRAGAIVKSLQAKRKCTCPCGSPKLVLKAI